MASGFERPSLRTLIGRIAGDLSARLDTGALELRRSLPGVLSRVWAEAANGLYAFLEVIAGEVMPDTARLWLPRHAGLWGLERIPAAYAVGEVRFAGADGTVVPAGTLLRRSDGLEYETLADVAVAAGSAVAAVRCRTAGVAGTLEGGRALPLVSPVAGLAGTAVVEPGGLTGGAEPEGDAALRARLLARIRQPPHGGAAFDYVTWARGWSAAVTRVWVAPQEAGIGTVTVRFMMDDTYPDGLPLPADVAALQAHIDALRPVTAEVFVGAPVPDPLALSIAGLQPDTPSVRAAIEAELRDLIRRESAPGGTLLLSRIREAISIAAGEADHELTLPAANVVAAPGHIVVFGSVTWL